MLGLARCLQEKGGLDEAEKIFWNLYNSNPADKQVGIGLARFLQEKEELDEAEKIYQDLYDPARPDKHVASGLSYCFKRRGKLEEALMILQPFSDDDEALHDISIIHSLRYCNEVLMSADVKTIPGTALAEARLSIDKALNMKKDAKKISHLAHIERLSGNEEQAKKLWEQAGRLDPQRAFLMKNEYWRDTERQVLQKLFNKTYPCD